MKIHRLLFVCQGNICRSPLAEGVFAHMAAEAGLGDAFHLDSAGTAGWNVGNPPDSRALAVAAARGIDISHLRARQVTRDDFGRFDLVLAMDEDNLQTLRGLAGDRSGDPGARIRPFLDFAPDMGLAGVPDPYYGGRQGFEDVLDMLEAASRGLLAHLGAARAAPGHDPESG